MEFLAAWRRLDWGVIAFFAFVFVLPTSPATAQCGDVNVGELDDVAGLVQVSYQGTRFSRRSGALLTYALVTNVSSDQEIVAPLLLVIDSISVAGVTLANPDGETPDGKPFVDLSGLVGDDCVLSPGETTTPRQLSFSNPSRRRFTFEASCIAVVPFGAPPAPVLDPHTTRTNLASATVPGSAPAGASVEVSGPQGVFEVPVAGGTFSADVPLGANRVNHFFFTTITSSGARSAPATTAITQDVQPPNLFVDFPTDGAEVTTATADVGGGTSEIF